MNLEAITDPSFVKNLNKKELEELASEIRSFLVENISKTGGHLASNLGVVELTIALNYVFDANKDKFIFDVGHQTYTHKILTGRAKYFKTLRQIDGMSGYAKRSESPYDFFEAGHSSTSISALAGLLFTNSENENIAIIGDASISSGVSMEAINYIGELSNKKAIIILNDNKMGIGKSVGALSKFLTNLRGSGFFVNLKKITYRITPEFLLKGVRQVIRGLKGFFQPDNIFEDLGFRYYGPVDGNDMTSVIKILTKAKEAKKSCVVHLITKKGKGYEYAENDNIGAYHGTGKFNIEEGIKEKEGYVSYSEIVSESIINLEKKYNIYVVIPAMIYGSKFMKFQKLYKEKLFDVGIAEEHAAIMSASLTLGGKKVFLPMYSTFAQRAYDEMLHDIARQSLNVVIGIDRAGIVGEDGDTHQGIFDVAFFSHIPNTIIIMPSTPNEVISTLDYAFRCKEMVVVRYPRLSIKYDLNNLQLEEINDRSWKTIKDGNKVCIISYGPELIRIESQFKNYDVMIVNALFIKPIDYKMLDKIFEKNIPIVVFEEIVQEGSLGSHIKEYAFDKGFLNKITLINIKDEFIPHGSIEDLKKRYKISIEDLVKVVDELCD